MIILFRSSDAPGPWIQAFRECAPEVELRVHPDIGNEADICAAFVFAPPHGLLARLPNLKLIISKGFGVDHLFADPHLPQDIPIVRLVDSSAIAFMNQYVAHAVLDYHRSMDLFRKAQPARRWLKPSYPDTALTTVGVLGLGALGSGVARSLTAFGFRVIGWSRTAKQVAGVECRHGAEALLPLLGQCQILVCLLALTPQTENILNARTLAALPKGAYLINAGRGGHVVEEDLLAALDSGALAGATLDVFRSEPLPPEHPFWSHPRITVTPHIATNALPRTAAAKVVDNIRRALTGQPLIDEVDRRRGY